MRLYCNLNAVVCEGLRLPSQEGLHFYLMPHTVFRYKMRAHALTPPIWVPLDRRAGMKQALKE